MSDATQIKGMGALPHAGGVAFRVWAPHAQRVSVIGSFNDWDGDTHPMHAEAHGAWYTDVGEAQIGDQYRFLLTTAQGAFTRIDPYAREVTTSVGNAIVYDPRFDWEGDDFHLAPWNELVIYELHVGTFNDEEDDTQPGQFKGVVARLGHLQRLGVNAIQIMPVAQFAGERSWGYNPSHIFSVELAYGGPVAFKRFVKRAHQQGIAVILDVVYNHLGPGDLDLWQFDGWSEHNRGGIYFYNDDRAHTPWGETRPDYGRGEVRQYILDNVCMWFEEYHVDGLRFDATQFIHTVDGSSDRDLPEGWSLLQWINSQITQQFPGRITIAEDLQNNKWLTKDVGAGGAGFGAQWDANFVHPIRQAVITCQDAQRSLLAIRDALCYRYNDDAFDRVIYSESHDEVANGKSRVPQEVSPAGPRGAGTRRNGRPWPPPWSSRRQASPCSSRARNSSKAPGSVTRSPSTGITATSSTASYGCTMTSSGCGSTATAARAASAGSARRSITYTTPAKSSPTAVGTRAEQGTTSWSSPTSSTSHRRATSSASRPQAPGTSVSIVIGRSTATTSQGIRAPTWSPLRARTTATPATPRCPLVLTVC